ncbi:MAG: DUF2723 domain-containing protein [Phycisphaerales bacterium]|nr:DUF2723 domain-containing protein [Phycisphaerales bacterium]
MLTGAALAIFMPACLRLPPGVCSGDGGDLQTACAVLGVAHPPGYAGLAAVGWCATRILSFLDPAWVVSLLCLACMTGAAVLAAAMLTRLGVSAWVSGVAALLLSQHALVWQNMVIPEVYAPGAVLLVTSTYLLLRYGATRRARDLMSAAAIFGFAVSQRPSFALMLPGMLGAWALIERRRRHEEPDRRWRRAAIRLAGILGAGAAPMALAAGLTYARIGPSSPYSCVQEHLAWERQTAGAGRIPEDRWRQVTWVLRAEEFRRFMGADAGQMRAKFRWVRSQCHAYGTLPFIALLALASLGTMSLARSNPPAAAAAWGIILGDLTFVLQYRIHDTAADLLPMLVMGALLLAAGVNHAAQRIMQAVQGVAGPLKRAALEAAGALALVCVIHAFIRYNHATWHATEFLNKLDLASLPADSVLCAPWADARVAWYAKLIASPRPDVDILGTDDPRVWVAQCANAGGRPVFFTHGLPPDAAGDLQFEPAGILFRATVRAPHAGGS